MSGVLCRSTPGARRSGAALVPGFVLDQHRNDFDSGTVERESHLQHSLTNFTHGKSC